MFAFTLDAQNNLVESKNLGENQEDLLSMGDHYINCLVVKYEDLVAAGDTLFSAQKALCFITVNQ
jgi:hypothetical protein